VNAPTFKRRTRSQGKKTFIIPEATSPSDPEDEPTASKRRISRTKASSKYNPFKKPIKNDVLSAK
jgi:hypothetical protein